MSWAGFKPQVILLSPVMLYFTKDHLELSCRRQILLTSWDQMLTLTLCGFIESNLVSLTGFQTF